MKRKRKDKDKTRQDKTRQEEGRKIEAIRQLQDKIPEDRRKKRV